MRRREFIALAVAAVAFAPFGVAAQPKVARIGFLSSASAATYRPRVDALRAGLRELGYEEGKNIAFEFRWAEGDGAKLPELAAELVRLKVDVLVTHATPPTRAAQAATATIPIVIAAAGDAVATGLVASLARPGRNTTGQTNFLPELTAKRLELLKEALPRIRRVAVLVIPDPITAPILKTMQSTAARQKVELQLFEVRAPGEFEKAFSEMTKKGAEAVVIPDYAMLVAQSKTVADLAAKQWLPAVGFSEFAQDGGLIGYGVNFLDMWRHAAMFVDKVLKGTKPADIPVEQATKFELVINQKTARALGITVPQSVLLRADKVIE